MVSVSSWPWASHGIRSSNLTNLSLLFPRERSPPRSYGAESQNMYEEVDPRGTGTGCGGHCEAPRSLFTGTSAPLPGSALRGQPSLASPSRVA